MGAELVRSVRAMCCGKGNKSGGCKIYDGTKEGSVERRGVLRISAIFLCPAAKSHFIPPKKSSTQGRFGSKIVAPKNVTKTSGKIPIFRFFLMFLVAF